MNWLNTPSGHIFVSLLLVAGGQVVEYLGMEYGREITVSGMAILARSMWGNAPAKPNKQTGGTQ